MTGARPFVGRARPGLSAGAGISGRGQDEHVAVRILELRERAPGLPARPFDDLDALLLQLPHRGLDVVARERAVEEGADAILVARRREAHEAGRRVRDAQLDPALARPHRLVGGDREAELAGIEGEGAFLVADRDADELEVRDHDGLLACDGAILDPQGRRDVASAAMAIAATVSLDAYVLDVLMPDLVGHDRKASAFVVYLYLCTAASRSGRDRDGASLQTIATRTGLSKSAVQSALRHLRWCGLVV